MSDIRKKADDIRVSYLTEEPDLLLEDSDSLCFNDLNLKRYSLDGHSWNGKPYVCLDPGRF